MATCKLCNGQAFELFASVECVTLGCKNFSQWAANELAPTYDWSVSDDQIIEDWRNGRLPIRKVYEAKLEEGEVLSCYSNADSPFDIATFEQSWLTISLSCLVSVLRDFQYVFVGMPMPSGCRYDQLKGMVGLYKVWPSLLRWQYTSEGYNFEKGNRKDRWI